jgi:hypothetical protein
MLMPRLQHLAPELKDNPPNCRELVAREAIGSRIDRLDDENVPRRNRAPLVSSRFRAISEAMQTADSTAAVPVMDVACPIRVPL